MIKTINTRVVTDIMLKAQDVIDGTTYSDPLSFKDAADIFIAMAEAAPAVEPAAWKHDCAALLMNEVELWIDACPHCGKPRTAAVEPAQAVRSGSCSNLMWATAEMREREHNRIGKMVGVLEQIKQEKLSALEPAQAGRYYDADHSAGVRNMVEMGSTKTAEALAKQLQEKLGAGK